MPTEALLIMLRILNIRVRVEGGVIRCKPARGVLPNDLVPRIRALKPQLLELLVVEDQGLNWRVETIGEALIQDVGERMPGVCSYCGLGMPNQQIGKCVLCCLASIKFLEKRDSAGRTTYPGQLNVEDVGRDFEAIRDMSPERREAA